MYRTAKLMCGVSQGRVGSVYLLVCPHMRPHPLHGVCWLQQAVGWQQGTLGVTCGAARAGLLRGSRTILLVGVS